MSARSSLNLQTLCWITAFAKNLSERLNLFAGSLSHRLLERQTSRAECIAGLQLMLLQQTDLSPAPRPAAAKFDELAHFEPCGNGYQLLPFRFLSLDNKKVIVNEVGEHYLLSAEDFGQFVR